MDINDFQHLERIHTLVTNLKEKEVSQEINNYGFSRFPNDYLYYLNCYFNDNTTVTNYLNIAKSCYKRR